MICEFDGCTDEAKIAVGAGPVPRGGGAEAYLMVCLAHVEEGVRDVVAGVLDASPHEHPLAAPPVHKLVANRLSDSAA